jgi:hypothetical protein
MKRLVAWTLMVVPISILAWSGLMAQSNPRLLAKFPGASMKWVHVAEPEFQREKLDLDKYNLSVAEENDSVTVGLMSLDCVDAANSIRRGSCGTHPGFVVVIRKNDMHVIRSYYVR